MMKLSLPHVPAKPPVPALFQNAATAVSIHNLILQATPPAAATAITTHLTQVSTGASLDREQNRKRLTSTDKGAFLSQLESCTTLRRDVKALMEFILDNAGEHGAEDLSPLLIDSWLQAPTLGKLYVLSDVMYNCMASAVPGASTISLMLQPHLSLGLSRLVQQARQAGRISDAMVSAGVASTLDAWTDWLVFSPEFLHGLRATVSSRRVGWDESRQRAEEEIARCTSSHEELLRACIVEGAPCDPSMSREQLLAALNLVGATPPEPVDGLALDEDEELRWVPDDD